jgi:hypothetical protein
VGRLIEVRHDAGYSTPEEVDASIARMKVVAATLRPNERVIVAADWRRCSKVVGTLTADRLLAMMLFANPYVIRSTLLIRQDSPTAVMQLMRLVDEAKAKDRRMFTSADDLIDWLGEVSTPEEHARLRAFLSE